METRPAIEVITLLEESVRDVRYLVDPSVGRPRPRTHAFISVGALALALAATLFGIAFAEVVRAHGPGMPPRVGGGLLDALALLALVGGTALLTRGLIRRARERRRDEASVAAALLDENSHGEVALVRPTGRRFDLVLRRGMRGEVTARGRRATVDELLAAGGPQAREVPVALEGDVRAHLTVGAVTILVSTSEAPATRHLPPPVDWRAHAYTGGAATAGALGLALLMAIPPDPQTLALDRLVSEGRMPSFVVKMPEPPEEKVPVAPRARDRGAASQKARGDAGKAGRPGATPVPRRLAVHGMIADNQRRYAREAATAAAEKAGILGILKAGEASQIGALFSPESALGPDAVTVMGGLQGTEIGETDGVGGLAHFGRRRGGGGDGDTIGMSALPTIGKGGLDPSGDYGRRVALLRDTKREVRVDTPTPEVKLVGTIDKEIVRRVIRHHLNEVKFCYDKELMRRQDIAGRVVARFLIDTNGRVAASAIESSTLAAPAVDRCIAEAVRRWEFPKPPGGVVSVSYPFQFKPAGL
jgi:TonB family protein